MANNYFQFKQFVIHQDSTAMKVGTDSVLLGAWAGVENAHNILDIGTGTGLLALMAAQRNLLATIDAVEIDVDAYNQAVINVDNTTWADRINLFNLPFQAYTMQCNKTYDVILSNPPYFNNSFKSPSNQRTQARHTDTLPFADIVTGVQKLLHANGIFVVVLPVTESEQFTQLANADGLYCKRRLMVKPNSDKAVVRVLSEFTKTPCLAMETELCIETGERHIYTYDYKRLTKDFYLKF